MTHLDKVLWAAKVRRLGWASVRQAMLKRGAAAADVAWVLVTTLMIQGA